MNKKLLILGSILAVSSLYAMEKKAEIIGRPTRSQTVPSILPSRRPIVPVELAQKLRTVSTVREFTPVVEQLIAGRYLSGRLLELRANFYELALIIAAQYGNVPVLKELLTMDVSPHIGEGLALELATRNQHYGAMDALIGGFGTVHTIGAFEVALQKMDMKALNKLIAINRSRFLKLSPMLIAYAQSVLASPQAVRFLETKIDAIRKQLASEERMTDVRIIQSAPPAPFIEPTAGITASAPY